MPAAWTRGEEANDGFRAGRHRARAATSKRSNPCPTILRRSIVGFGPCQPHRSSQCWPPDAQKIDEPGGGGDHVGCRCWPSRPVFRQFAAMAVSLPAMRPHGHAPPGQRARRPRGLPVLCRAVDRPGRCHGPHAFGGPGTVGGVSGVVDAMAVSMHSVRQLRRPAARIGTQRPRLPGLLLPREQAASHHGVSHREGHSNGRPPGAFEDGILE